MVGMGIRRIDVARGRTYAGQRARHGDHIGNLAPKLRASPMAKARGPLENARQPMVLDHCAILFGHVPQHGVFGKPRGDQVLTARADDFYGVGMRMSCRFVGAERRDWALLLLCVLLWLAVAMLWVLRHASTFLVAEQSPEDIPSGAAQSLQFFGRRGV